MKELYNMKILLKEHQWSLGKFIRQFHKIYLLVDMKGNIGDHLIWAGTSLFLEGLEVPYNKISIDQISNCCSCDTAQATLLIPGSGAFDKRWHEWLPQLVIDATERFENVVILPSSYDIEVPIVQKCLRQKNVFAFAREPKSFRSIKLISNASLSYDCALYFDFDKIETSDAEGLLCALRDDAGSMIDKNIYSLSAINNDISLTANSLKEWLSQIANAAIVITDRLHIAVASIMLHKELIYFDPYDQKISTYFHYVFSNSTPHKVKKEDIHWLENNGYIHRGEVK